LVKKDDPSFLSLRVSTVLSISHGLKSARRSVGGRFDRPGTSVPGHRLKASSQFLVRRLESFQPHNAFRHSMRFPGDPAISPNGPLVGLSFVSTRVSLNFWRMFPRLCLCAHNSVFRKQSLRFRETRFECSSIAVEGQLRWIVDQAVSFSTPGRAPSD
jgi:hypothetical protein